MMMITMRTWLKLGIFLKFTKSKLSTDIGTVRTRLQTLPIYKQVLTRL
jgi:hypothetical protein